MLYLYIIVTIIEIDLKLSKTGQLNSRGLLWRQCFKIKMLITIKSNY